MTKYKVKSKEEFLKIHRENYYYRHWNQKLPTHYPCIIVAEDLEAWGSPTVSYVFIYKEDFNIGR